MDDGVAPGSNLPTWPAAQGTWTPDRAEQLFWGARYIDDAVGRRRSAAVSNAGNPTPVVTWGDLQYYLTDAQFSVVVLMDSGKAPGFDILERVKYDPYGRGLHCRPGDLNGGGGAPNSQDYNDFLAAYFTPSLAGDTNRNGAVSVQDLFDFIALWNTPGHTPTGGQVSSPDAADGHDNCVGYCGYVQNAETGDYTVRFSTYMPGLGRWLERDPAGYVAGSSLQEYVSSHATLDVDPGGLEPYNPNDERERCCHGKIVKYNIRPASYVPRDRSPRPHTDPVDDVIQCGTGVAGVLSFGLSRKARRDFFPELEQWVEYDSTFYKCGEWGTLFIPMPNSGLARASRAIRSCVEARTLLIAGWRKAVATAATEGEKCGCNIIKYIGKGAEHDSAWRKLPMCQR